MVLQELQSPALLIHRVGDPLLRPAVPGELNLIRLNKDLWTGAEVSETDYRAETRLANTDFWGPERGPASVPSTKKWPHSISLSGSEPAAVHWDVTANGKSRSRQPWFSVWTLPKDSRIVGTISCGIQAT